jgi:hypothetical protein
LLFSLVINPIIILADNLAVGVFELKRFYGAEGEEILNEFSDGIYEVSSDLLHQTSDKHIPIRHATIQNQTRNKCGHNTF